MDATLKALRIEIRAFARGRDLEELHRPKNLSMALAVEASEPLDIFQWLTPAESENLSPIQRAEAVPRKALAPRQHNL
jgi:dCTP diphosphatase